MLNVSAAVKAKLKSDVCLKELRITVGNVVCTNSDIYKDSFKLTESVMDSKVELVGCISSVLEMKVSTSRLPKDDYSGTPVSAAVAVYLDANTLSDYIPLFVGFVDTCEKSADGHWQTFTCFDTLAYLTDTAGYNQYKAAFHGGSVTLEDFRERILTAYDIEVEYAELPNDDLKFKKRWRNKDITALALIRYITQINGAFGIMNRYGHFEYRYIDDNATPESIPYYRSMRYSQSYMDPINKGLTIRTNSQDAGVTVTWSNYTDYAGTDPGWNDDSQDHYLIDPDDEDITDGNYIIEGNLIAYKLKKGKKQVIAANIMAQVGHDAVFRDYSVTCNGLPYIECCDKVLFTKADNTQIEFVVTKRILQGVQNMTDTYECKPTQETVSTSTGSVSTTNSSYVSNVADSTVGVSRSPTNASESEDLLLIDKYIISNGEYLPEDEDEDVGGYNKITVNVPDTGGMISGVTLEAVALQHGISAYNKVTVIKPSGQTTAVQVPCSIPANTQVASDDHKYVYYKSGTDIYRLPINDLTGEPELWKHMGSTHDYDVIVRHNLIYDREVEVLYVLINGSYSEHHDVSSISLDDLTDGYIPVRKSNQPGLMSLVTGRFTSWDGAGRAPGPGLSSVETFYRGSGYYRVYDITGATKWDVGLTFAYGYILTAKDGFVYTGAQINGTNCLIKFNAAAGSSTAVTILSGVSSTRVETGNPAYTPVWYMTGSANGLVVAGDTVKQYSNITAVDSKAVAFSRFFWDGSHLWDLDPQEEYYMIQNDGTVEPLIPDGYEFFGIGYAKEDVEWSESGEACILFS